MSDALPWSGLRIQLRKFSRVYDPWLRFITGESSWKDQLVKQVAARPGERILNIGCGRGALAIALKQAQPAADVTVVDSNSETIERARERATRAGVDIHFERCSVVEPSVSGYFDCIVSSLLFHHLLNDDKRRMLKSAYGMLLPGGRLEIGDWGKAQDFLMRSAFLLVQMLDGRSRTIDNVRGLVPTYIAEAGFVDVLETQQERTPLGTMSLYSARRPS